MSVTIVTTVPTQATATGNGSSSGDASSTTQGFAELLSGQLARSDVSVASDSTELTTDLAAIATDTPDVADLFAALGLVAQQDIPLQTTGNDSTSEDDAKTQDPLSFDADPEQAASLLAAMGLAATPTSAPAAPTVAEASSATDALSTVGGGAGQLAKPQGETLAINSATGLNTPAPADSQAANFAAILTTAEETANSKNDSSDTNANNISSLTGNVSGQTGIPSTQHNSTLTVATAVRDQNWATDLGQKVVWLANADKQSAQLTLNPQEMGPIEISLDLDKGTGTASVSFTSANAEVRDALETALPRLREMFATAGIELGQTNVGAQSFSQQQSWNGAQNQSSSRETGDNAILATEAAGTLQTGVLPVRQGNGMVDVFA